MNGNAIRFFHRHAIHTLAPVAVLIAGCAVAPPPQPLDPPIPELAGTHWTVTQIDGRETLRGDELTADFGVDGRINGDSGCNHFSGPFVQTGTTVNFGEVLSTRRACVEDGRQRQENRMLSILHGATRVHVAGDELRVNGSAGSLTLIQTDMASAAYVVRDAGPVPAGAPPRRIDYDCQGIRISVEYGADVARVISPDGYDVLELRPDRDGAVRYQSAHSEIRVGRDLLWGREGGLPRSCLERR